ncbi:MAG: S8 family serine peptidase [Lachnospiraceae bacterium]|nr:S8 family serine peptidase [Lachnospiraceae bacterium]
MRKQKILSLALSMVLGVSMCGVNAVSTSKEISGETEKGELKVATKEVSVYDQIKKTDIDEDELNAIADLALTDGKQTAEKVNAYTNKTDYEAALNYALTSYYKTENFDEMDAFESALDNRADEIVKGYEEAAEERAAGLDNGYEPGEVLALFNEGTSKEEIEAICEAGYGEVENIYENFDGTYSAKISISLGQTVDKASDFYDDFCITDAAGKNTMREAAKNAEDVLYDPQVSYQYYLNTIDAVGAWDYVHSHEHSRVVVGVVDSGVNYNVPDIANRISPLSADVAGDETILLSDMETPYTSQHGTWVSSTICSEANGEGIAGVASCYDNSVVDVIVMQAGTYLESYHDARFFDDDVMKAYNYLAAHGVKVVNESLGGWNYSSYMESFYQRMIDNGIIVVVSAGNENIETTYYPSDYPATISVAATNRNNGTADFTNYGNLKDVCAPGVSIYAYGTSGNLQYVDGTSFSSPITASVVAMMCSLNPSLTSSQARSILKASTTPLAQGSKYVPYGVINAYECVKAVGGVEKSYVEPVSTKPEPTTVDPDSILDEVEGLTVVGAWNSLVAMWNPTQKQIEKGYTYNVYVNSNLEYANTTLTGFSKTVPAGGYVVTIKSVYNGQESEGVSKYVNVRGDTTLPTTTAPEVTTPEETTPVDNYVTAARGWNNLPYWSLYVADGWAGNPEAQYIDGNSYNSFKLKLDNGSTEMWAVQLKTNEIAVTPGVEYQCKVKVNSKNNSVSVRIKDDKSGTENFVGFRQGENNVTLNFTPTSSTAQIFFDFGMAPPNTEYEITSFELTPVNEETTTIEEATTVEETTTIEETTTVEETTTASEFVNANGGWNDAGAWDVYQAEGWGNDPLVSYKASSTPRDFELKVNKASGSEWAIQARTDEMQLENGANYTCSLLVKSNIGGTIRFKEDGSGTETMVTLYPGSSTTVNLDFASVGSAQFFFDLGNAPEGLQIKIREFEVNKKVVATERNLALGKNVTVSSEEGGDTLAQYAVDGNASTRWSSQFADNQWIMVDLGEVFSLSAVGIDWEAAYSDDYTIYTSLDGVNWGATNNQTLDHACKYYTRTTVNARYVKVVFNHRATPYGCSMYELEVMGKEILPY